MFDVIIIGGGPAGLTAAIYTRRANKSALVLEKATFGGQITFSPKVENIPGFLPLSGNEFAEKLVEQALELGVEVESCEVLSVKDRGDRRVVETDSGEFEGRAVILATGAKHRTLGLPKEEAFIGEGISFCAVCDGAFYRDRDVAVIGGGNSALQEALLLADLAKSVTVVQNLDFLTGEAMLQKNLAEKSNVRVILGTVLDAYLGDDALTGIRVKRVSDGALSEIPCDGVFLAIGLVPQNEAFAEHLALDARGYAEATEACTTKTPWLFVAGDCRTKSVRQVATAASDGAIAALAACAYLDR